LWKANREPSYDVVFVGSLGNWDLILADALTRQGLRCAVVRKSKAPLPSALDAPAVLGGLEKNNVHVYRGADWFYCFTRRAGCVICLTSSLPYFLLQWWLCLPFVRYPPIINISTGSDVAELARRRSLHGRICRQVLERAAVNLVPAYPETLRSLATLRLG